MQKYALHDTDLMLGLNSDHEPTIKQYDLKIHDRDDDNQPVKKLLLQGPSALSTTELVAILFDGKPTNEKALEMAAQVTREYGEHTLMSQTDATKLAHELEIPIAKAVQLVACGELGRRFFKKREGRATVIRTAQDVYDYVADMRNLPKEHLRGLYLNMHYQIIHDEVLSIGTLTSNLIHPREVFKPALEYNAAGIVLVHNHPSGVVDPSQADILTTIQLIYAGRMIGINVIDHVIVTRDTFTSIEVNYEAKDDEK